MKNVMGIINLGDEHECLKELTQFRCLASVPFGSKYRLIDFILSNMVNSGIQNIGIFTLDKYRSLLDHVGTGSEWDLDRKKDGLFILPPAIFSLEGGYKGDVQNFYGNLDYLNKSNQEFVIISGSKNVCKINFQELVTFHIQNNADLTIVHKEDYNAQNGGRYRSLEITKGGRITGVNCVSDKTESVKNISLDILVVKKELLIKLIKKCIEDKRYNFLTDVIYANVDKLKIYGFPFQGYLSIIDSLASYYSSSLELLKPEIYKELFFQPDPIYTRTKNQPPTKYLENSAVRSSILANGCLIEGEVNNCIIFDGVKIKKGAVIKNSILLPSCEIGEFAVVENCILEKEVQISEREILKGNHYTVFGRRSVI